MLRRVEYSLLNCGVGHTPLTPPPPRLVRGCWLILRDVSSTKYIDNYIIKTWFALSVFPNTVHCFLFYFRQSNTDPFCRT